MTGCSWWFLLTVGFAVFLNATSVTSRVVIVNKGVPGQNSEEGRKCFNADVLNLHPRFVLLYFGLNDALNEPKFVDTIRYVQNLRWMVRTSRQHNVIPILCSIQHVDAERLLQRHRPTSFGREGTAKLIDITPRCAPWRHKNRFRSSTSQARSIAPEVPFHPSAPMVFI